MHPRHSFLYSFSHFRSHRQLSLHAFLPLPYPYSSLQPLPHLHRRTSGLRKGKGRDILRPVKNVHTHTHTHHTRAAPFYRCGYICTAPSHLPKRETSSEVATTTVLPLPLRLFFLPPVLANIQLYIKHDYLLKYTSTVVKYS